MDTNCKCLIVDDEPLAIRLIEKHVAQMPQLELVGTCQNAIEAFEFLKKTSVDLIFLDIEMPVLTGIDFVKSLQHPPSIIFTTAYRNYAVESYELSVIDYLVKPITFTRFFKAVNKYLNQNRSINIPSIPIVSSSSVQEYIYVNSNKKNIKVEFKEILYVESIKDYVRIHTPTKSVMTKDKISDFEKKLPSNFLRIHRSFIVNIYKITAYTAHDVEIENKEIPIGISYKKQVQERLK